MTDRISENFLAEKIKTLETELSQLNILFDLSRTLNYASDVISFAEKLVEFLKDTTGAGNIACFIQNNEKYKLISSDNAKLNFFPEFENLKEGIWQIIEAGQPFPVTDENGKCIYARFFKHYNLEGLKSSIWMPFIYAGKVLAIISLGEKENNEPYTPEDFKFLKKIVEYSSPALNRFDLKKADNSHVSELQKTLHNISILYNIGQAMNFIDDLKKLLKIILAKAIEATAAEKGSLMLYDPSCKELVVKVVYGLPDKEVEEKINDGLIECTKIKIGEGIAGEVFSTKRAIITNLGSDDPRFKQSHQSRVTSILCIPLIVKGESIGVINISNKLNGKFFNQDDLDFMSALANQAAVAINNAQLYELAITDGLTKLYIYRHFRYLLDTEIKRSIRYNRQFSLIMMDVDNFKLINDTYGHPTGDCILKEISEAITLSCRKIDLASRYGGEEFALILPETCKENAKIMAERLRQKIEAIIIYTKTNLPVSPTISIGIAGFPEDGNDQENLIEAADNALYFAKKQGKNCVAEYSSDGCSLVDCLPDV